jgi:hypothetical protein
VWAWSVLEKVAAEPGHPSSSIQRFDKQDISSKHKTYRQPAYLPACLPAAW